MSDGCTTCDREAHDDPRILLEMPDDPTPEIIALAEKLRNGMYCAYCIQIEWEQKTGKKVATLEI